MAFARLFKLKSSNKAKKSGVPVVAAEEPVVAAEVVEPAVEVKTPAVIAEVRPLVVRKRNANPQHHSLPFTMREEPAPSPVKEHPYGINEDDAGLIPTDDAWLAQEYPALYCIKADHYQHKASSSQNEDWIEDDSSSEMWYYGGESDSETESLPRTPLESAVDIYPRAPLSAEEMDAIVRDDDAKPKYALSMLESKLIPLAEAQNRADVKYRPEGFEMKEAKEAAKAAKAAKENAAKAKFVNARRAEEKVWWC